jgi:hypothetical protein
MHRTALNRESTRTLSGLVLPIAIFLLVAGCSGDVANPVIDTFLSGTYTGEFVDSRLGTIPDGTLQIAHSGTSITGTLLAGRTGTLTATLQGSTFEGTFTFTDDCPGAATTFGDVSEGTRILGGFQGTDCEGAHAGTYSLLKQP